MEREGARSFADLTERGIHRGARIVGEANQRAAQQREQRMQSLRVEMRPEQAVEQHDLAAGLGRLQRAGEHHEALAQLGIVPAGG